MNDIPRLISNKAIATFFLSIFLSSMIFSSSGTFITSFYNGTVQYLGDSNDTLIISSNVSATIATSHVPYWLITPLSQINGIIGLSPETIAACSSDAYSFFIRGVVPSEFFKSQAINIIEGRNLVNNDTLSIILGYRLANRLEKHVGDTIFLFSALVNDYAIVKVIGIYRSETLLDDEGIVPLSIGSMLSDTYPSYVNLIRITYNTSIISKTELIDTIYVKRNITISISRNNISVSNIEVSLLRFDLSLERYGITNSSGCIVFTNLLMNTYFIKIKDNNSTYIYSTTHLSNQNLKIDLSSSTAKTNSSIVISTFSDGSPISNLKVLVLSKKTNEVLFSKMNTAHMENISLSESEILIYLFDGISINKFDVNTNITNYLEIDLHRSKSLFYQTTAYYIPFIPSHLKVAPPTSLIRSSFKQIIGITENMLWAILLVVTLLSLLLIRVITNTFFSEVRRNISVIRMLGAKIHQSISYIIPIQIFITAIASVLGYICGFASVYSLVNFDLLLIGGHSYYPIFSSEILLLSILMPLFFSLITLVIQIYRVYSNPLSQMLSIRFRELSENNVETELK